MPLDAHLTHNRRSSSLDQASGVSSRCEHFATSVPLSPSYKACKFHTIDPLPPSQCLISCCKVFLYKRKRTARHLRIGLSGEQVEQVLRDGYSGARIQIMSLARSLRASRTARDHMHCIMAVPHVHESSGRGSEAIEREWRLSISASHFTADRFCHLSFEDLPR